MNTEELLEATQALPGWMSMEKGRRVIQLVIESKAEQCVELGVFGARTLICMAFGLQALGRGCADGVDPYTPAAALEGVNDPANDAWWGRLDYEDIARTAQTAIYRFGLVRYAQLIRMRSLEVVDYYADGSVDLLHQDSNHSMAVTCEEVTRWAPKIRPGGYWIFDDTNWESTKKAQQMLVELGFEELEDHVSWKIYRR